MFKQILLVFWATCLTDYVAFGNAISSKIGDHRNIIGGQCVPAPHPYSHQISLRQGPYHICGGAIIDERRVLTAAHCVFKQNSKILNIVVGAREIVEPADTYSIKTIYGHEMYDPTTYLNDIALLITDNKIEFNDRVKPIKIYDGVLGTGKTCTATGWGRWNLNSPNCINTLQELNTSSLSFQGCTYTQYQGTPPLDYKKQLCVFKTTGKGLCQGDSGGPLIYKNQLIGLVSWGRSCAAGFPDVFVRVYGFIDWIYSKEV